MDPGRDQFRGESWQELELSIRVPPFVKNILALYPAEFPHGNEEGVAGHSFGRELPAWVQDTDARHLARLLRRCGARRGESTGE